MINPDEIYHQRTIYNFFDLMGDTGGILQFFSFFGSFITFICTGQQMSQHVIEKVFKFGESSRDKKTTQNHDKIYK